MEKTLDLGAFEELGDCEKMAFDGGRAVYEYLEPLTTPWPNDGVFPKGLGDSIANAMNYVFDSLAIKREQRKESKIISGGLLEGCLPLSNY